MELRIAGIVKETVVDGPGVRMAIFTQGCKHNCKGCQNPETHKMDGGHLTDTDAILNDFRNKTYLAGITLSGGEPMLQPEAIAEIAKGVKEVGKNVVIYTGYTYEQLLEMAKENPAYTEILENTWLLIDGRYEEDKRDIGLAFRGSSNQRIIDVAESLNMGEIVLKEF